MLPFCQLGPRFLGFFPLLFTVVLISIHSPALASSAPRQLAAGILDAHPLGSQGVLCQTMDGKFETIELATGKPVPWQLDWSPAEDGWEAPAVDDTSRPNFTTSRDGRLVALGINVRTGNGALKPEDQSPLFETAIVLCAADGSGARCVALAEQTDGGPRLYFTQDAGLLVGPEYLPCDPGPDALRGWFKSMDSQSAMELKPVNAVETLTGRRLELPALAEAAWLEKCPYSDDYMFDEMDTPVVHYGQLTGPHAGLSGKFAPPKGDEEGYSQSWWVAPGRQLDVRKGRQLVVTMDGQTHSVHGGPWTGYCWLPDGRSYFSRDGGQTIELGKVDWLTGKVTGAQPRPDLAFYAVPHKLDEWPERVDAWTALPDGSGVLIREPGAGGLALVR